MDLTLLGSLAALALIDSTSFGTLLIPIWLLLHPGRVRAGRVLVFLGTVAAFYFVVGTALVLGADALLPRLAPLADNDAVHWVQLTVGVAMFILSFRMGRRRKPGADPAAGRIARWRARAMGAAGPEDGLAADGSAVRTRAAVAPLIGLALTAALLEVGTMLPYLAAIGLLTNADLPAGSFPPIMAAYCLVMIVPALLLLALRLVAGRRIEPVLTRISAWMTNSDTLGWIVGIAGFLIARDALWRLGIIG